MSTDQQATTMTINAAARYLDVSENAIRQRIKRGTLPAEKVNGVWMVNVADQETDHHADHEATTRPTTTPTDTDHQAFEVPFRVMPEEIEQAIERTGDKYVADISAIADRFERLYSEQLKAKDETIMSLRSERDTFKDLVGREREIADELRQRAEALESRLSEHEARNKASLSVADSAPQTNDTVPWWQFWRRE